MDAEAVRAIPAAPFIEDVEAFVRGSSIEGSISSLQEMLSKYRFMESSTLQKKQALASKIPELSQTLSVLDALQGTESLSTSFELSDTLYADAQIDSTDSADIMVQYPIDDARTLIEDKLRRARQSHIEASEDLDFLRDQATVVEVNIARLHNHGVLLKRRK